LIRTDLEEEETVDETLEVNDKPILDFQAGAS